MIYIRDLPIGGDDRKPDDGDITKGGWNDAISGDAIGIGGGSANIGGGSKV